MIKLLKPLHHSMGTIGVAVSGGIDSMAALAFLMQYPQNQVIVYNVDHGTEFGKRGTEFVMDFCDRHKIRCGVYRISSKKPTNESWEEYWRNERYKFFHSYLHPIITAHNLDDNIENWLFSAIHGNPKVIPYSNRNVIRPFMLNTKAELRDFLVKKGIEWLDDPSNNDVRYMRNRIRHNIVPEALQVNPGLYKVIAKKLKQNID